MSIGNVRIGKSVISDTIYAGYLNKEGTMWKGNKKDITNDFLSVTIERWNGYSEIIEKHGKDGVKKYQIIVKEIK